jgi:dTDP-4-amino-4,6-dideoxygalactose transaminase/acetyltransferase-like isoleucine patch superfamily enzyme/dTDP-4-dehydrorhamnose 3,5-epimerase-like enzyme
MSTTKDYQQHENALVDEGAMIGKDTRVWAFAHIQAGAVVGAGCNIGENVFIESGAIIGDDVTVKNGVQIWDSVVLQDNVFVGPNVTFCNDKYPRSKQYLTEHPQTVVSPWASIGANATILPGIKIGPEAFIGAGSVVTHDVSAKTVVAGNPARLLRFNSVKKDDVGCIDNTDSKDGIDRIILQRLKAHSDPVRVWHSPVFVDRRGKLTVTEYEKGLPWRPQRMFMIYDTPKAELRGYHAHKSTYQCLVCVKGAVNVLVDNGVERREVKLDSPNKSLLIPPMIWSSQTYLEAGSVLVVLASEKHIPEKYIHDYRQFLELAGTESPSLDDKTDDEAVGDCEPTDVHVPFLDLKAINKPYESQFHTAFSRVLESGCFVLGPEVEAFEAEWANYCGALYCVGLGSGLAALHLLLLAADIQPHHEVIVPSNTYIATVLAISQAGAKPVLVEPNPLTHTLDAIAVKAAITANTHSILTVDLYGQTSDMDPICALANECGIYTFADSAQGHGAKYKDRKTGSHCDASCFSFYPSKNLGALGEAGAVVTSNEALADKVRVLRNYGSRIRYYNEYKGVNERMDPVQAAMLRCKIPDLDELNAKRSATADRYMKGLAHLNWLTLPVVPKWSTPCWHLFVVNAQEHRDALLAHLKSHKIDSIIHYPVPPHLQKCNQDLGHEEGSFPVAEKLAKSILSIPICPTLTDEQVSHVIHTVSSFDPA